MTNRIFRDAYEAAATELESLLKEQERIEERILSLRKTMNSLATVISQVGDNTDFLDKAAASLRDLIDTSLTDDIHRIVSGSPCPLTAMQIRDELKELGGSLAEQSNPMATIHAILNRLAESGRVHETVKDGKKAWERMSRMAEAFAKAKRLKDIPPPPPPRADLDAIAFVTDQMTADARKKNLLPPENRNQSLNRDKKK